jgi:menaquinone-dependent protoporphyrinogen oxidase
MNTKSILLAYASRYGSTQEVAETMAATLRENGLDVDLQPMQSVKQLENYDAIVLGAAIYGTRWHPDAHHFLAQYQAALSQRPLAIFALGPLTGDQIAMQRSRRQLDRDLEKVPWLKPVALEIFVGKYDTSKLSFFERFLPSSDHRNWDAIRAWANALPVQLQIREMPSHLLSQ